MPVSYVQKRDYADKLMEISNPLKKSSEKKIINVLTLYYNTEDSGINNRL